MHLAGGWWLVAGGGWLLDVGCWVWIIGFDIYRYSYSAVNYQIASNKGFVVFLGTTLALVTCLNVSLGRDCQGSFPQVMQGWVLVGAARFLLGPAEGLAILLPTAAKAFQACAGSQTRRPGHGRVCPGRGTRGWGG